MTSFVPSPGYVLPLPTGHAEGDLRLWQADQFEPTAADLAEQSLAEAATHPVIAGVLAAALIVLATGGDRDSLHRLVLALDPLAGIVEGVTGPKTFPRPDGPAPF